MYVVPLYNNAHNTTAFHQPICPIGYYLNDSLWDLHVLPKYQHVEYPIILTDLAEGWFTSSALALPHSLPKAENEFLTRNLKSSGLPFARMSLLSLFLLFTACHAPPSTITIITVRIHITVVTATPYKFSITFFLRLFSSHKTLKVLLWREPPPIWGQLLPQAG